MLRSMFLHPKIINCQREVLRTDRFMKIDINHPQYTRILPVKWGLDITSRLEGVRQQRICTGPFRSQPTICRNKLTKICGDQVYDCYEKVGHFYRVS